MRWKHAKTFFHRSFPFIHTRVYISNLHWFDSFDLPSSTINRCAIKTKIKNEAKHKQKNLCAFIRIDYILHRIKLAITLAFYLIYLVLCLCVFVTNFVLILFWCYCLAPLFSMHTYHYCLCVNNTMSIGRINAKIRRILCKVYFYACISSHTHVIYYKHTLIQTHSDEISIGILEQNGQLR